MATFPKFDEEFKQNVSAKFQDVKEKVSDALLTEDGSLDTEKIGNAVGDTIKKVEEGVKDGYQKFSDNYMKEDGKLDKEKVGAAVNNAYQKGGRLLATGMTKLAEKLADKFGVQEHEGQIIDSELVTQEPAAEETQEPAAEETQEPAPEENQEEA